MECRLCWRKQAAAADQCESFTSATMKVRFWQKLPVGHSGADGRQGAPICDINVSETRTQKPPYIQLAGFYSAKLAWYLTAVEMLRLT